MNGWQRLWVVGCVLGAMVVIAIGCTSVTREQDIRDAWAGTKRWRMDVVIERENQLVKGIQPGEFLDQQIAIGQHRVDAEAERIDNLMLTDLDDLSNKQIVQVVQLIGAWFAWAVGTYFIGWGIGWVIRGFRPNGKSAS